MKSTFVCNIIVTAMAAYLLSACAPVKMENSSSPQAQAAATPGGSQSEAGQLGVGDGTPRTPTYPTIPPATTGTGTGTSTGTSTGTGDNTGSTSGSTTTTTTPPPDIDSPAPTDPTSAAARCAQLSSHLPALSSTVYGDVAGGVVRQVFNGQSINKIISAISDVEAYANSIVEADTGAANNLFAAKVIGDVSAGFGTIYFVGYGPGSYVNHVIAGAPATIVLCNMNANSIAIGVGKLILVNSQVNELLGAAIDVVEVNSNITKTTVGLLNVKK